MPANVNLQVPAHLVQAVDAILAERPEGGQGEPTAREAYLTAAIVAAIETDAATLSRPALGRFIRRPT